MSDPYLAQPSSPQHAPRQPHPAPAGFRPILIVWYLCAGLLGAVVGLVGTVMHRQWMPWILVVALITVAVAGVLVRAWLGGGGLVPYAIGWFVVVQLFAAQGPGGDVIMPAQPISYVWMIGGMVMIGVAAFAPRSWFSD
ncbi:DUF6113 family protein [Sanguibacter suarezii]|uniref:DUF6113 family protein n=1 Tax=Sanguibacter suarezii TaxID=60921 RepID=UPI0009FE58D5|nr:DUF6113 family protein [Sanguibacter suarezii]